MKVFVFNSLVLVVLGTLQVTSAGCCADGWTSYRSHCYFIAYGVELTFADAQRYCKARGAYLTRLETWAENIFLRKMLSKSKAVHTWMGLSDQTYESIWRWADTNKHATFSDWRPGEPNNLGNEDCVAFYAGSANRWNDYPCQRKLTPLCEKS
ncbi:perlucin-like protein [Mercenaria mercenaria]|uniref:perlucin-like protein n=1 Tax=Mercenaria mercenaria TaxID=6596 RepID=UPI00234ED914|nr:perlucin-like protein [Mercenaria mercenaria]